MAKRNTYNVDESLETPFDLRNFLRCVPYVKKHLKYLIGALIFSVCATLLGLLGPIFTQIIIDDLIPQRDIAAVIFVAVLYFLSACGAEACGYFQTRLTSRAGHRIIHSIRKDVFGHIQKLSFNYFDSRPRGKILVRVVHYVNNVADFLSNGLVNLVVQVLTILFILFFMLSLSPNLTLCVLAGVPFIILFVLNCYKQI